MYGQSARMKKLGAERQTRVRRRGQTGDVPAERSQGSSVEVWPSEEPPCSGGMRSGLTTTHGTCMVLHVQTM